MADSGARIISRKREIGSKNEDWELEIRNWKDPTWWRGYAA
jgi:hypothetical protein